MPKEVDKTTVGGRIQYLRTKAGLTQDELAELLSIGIGQVFHYMK